VTNPAEESAPDHSLVRARGLTKRFGTFVAVDAIDFDVREGEAFGFLGPNGAGKTSAMRMIGCVSPVSGGDLTVLDLDPRRDGARIRARLGVVPQLDNLDLELTVLDNLLLYGRYFDLPRAESRRRAEELLDFVQLRLVIARALINDPAMLLLDEPTTGLDPQARQLVWDRLYNLKQRGTTLLLTTHYMDEAEQLCDRLVVMDSAKIVAEGSPQELIERYASREVVELRLAEGAEQSPDGRLDGMADRVERIRDRVLLSTADGDRTVAELRRRGVPTRSVLVRRGTLEDVFLRLTGRALIE
jgi:lipooligosaccharide transport system ATP-binding protein